jgi:hypothetical protein
MTQFKISASIALKQRAPVEETGAASASMTRQRTAYKYMSTVAFWNW